MGAISGIFQRRNTAVCKETLLAQSELLAHRGPVSASIYCAGPIGLLHRRDAVSPAVHSAGQPYHHPDGRYHIVVSGRIFNAPEIGSALAARGKRVGDSILAIMLEAWVAWGEDAFRRFNGGFACAIWDSHSCSLTLARDHCGLKPLYFSATADAVVFASEVKAVLAYPSLSRHPDETGIVNFLALNRYLFRTSHTFYRDVQRLLPAESVTFGPAGDGQRQLYWQIQPGAVDTFSNDVDRIEGVRALLYDAVRIRLPDTNDFGAALSGGFDSSSIVCLVDEISRRNPRTNFCLNTFSFDFNSADADELDLIEVVAKRVGARHHHLDALRADLFDDLDAVIHAHDGPILESSILLLWDKKRRAKAAGLNVLLSGLGGDEVFMGTLHYLCDLFRTGNWAGLIKAMASIYPLDKSTGRRTSLPHLVLAYVLSPLLPDWLRRLRGTAQGMPFPPPWIASDLLKRTGFDYSPPRERKVIFESAFDAQNYALFNYELLNGAIPFHDDCSAAFALDTRFPLLDIRLVETLFATERRWKLDANEVRRLQKAAMAPFLPPEILRDHLKKNFHHALHRYTQRALEGPVKAMLAGSAQPARAYLNWSYIERSSADFLAGRLADPAPVWLALNLNRWLAQL